MKTLEIDNRVLVGKVYTDKYVIAQDSYFIGCAFFKCDVYCVRGFDENRFINCIFKESRIAVNL